MLDALFFVALIAYVVWFAEIFRNPALLLGYGEGGVFDIKSEVSNIPGVTSFTQAGIPFVIAYMVATRYCNQAPPARTRIYFYALFVLAMLRVTVWTERLAFLELVVPVMVLYIGARERVGGVGRRLLVFAPVLGGLLLVLMFGATEYFRSWMTHYSKMDQGFAEFVVNRISIYYVAAVNTALAFLSEFDDWPRWDGTYIFAGLYSLPVVGSLARELFNLEQPAYSDFLASYLDQEFNNFSGLYLPVADLGLAGGLLYLCCFAFVAGRLWSLFARGHAGGLLFYPLFFLTIVELLRVFYLGGSRTIIPLLVLGLIYLFGFNRRDTPRRNVREGMQ